MTFDIRFKPSVEKDLRSLPKTIVRRVVQKVEALADDPLPVQSRKLRGTEQLYRVRVGSHHSPDGVPSFLVDRYFPIRGLGSEDIPGIVPVAVAFLIIVGLGRGRFRAACAPCGSRRHAEGRPGS